VRLSGNVVADHMVAVSLVIDTILLLLILLVDFFLTLLWHTSIAHSLFIRFLLYIVCVVTTILCIIVSFRLAHILLCHNDVSLIV